MEGRVVAALVVAQVLFGLHYLAAKILLQQIPPRTWAVFRVAAAAAVLFAAARVLRSEFPRTRRDVGRLALFSVFGVVINQVCFVEGLSRTTPIHSALINTTIPVGTLLFAVAARRETLTGAKVLSISICLAGVLLVIRPEGVHLFGTTVVGDLLTLVNATSYALFLVLSKRLLSRTDPLAATAVLMGFGSLGILALGAPQLAVFRPTEVSAQTWALAAFIIVGPTAGAYLLHYWALARVDSSLVALFIYLQPVIALALSALVLGEVPGTRELGGGALIFLGVYLALARGRKLRTR